MPEIGSANAGLDAVVRKAWLWGYGCTSDMLSELRALLGSTGQGLECMARRVFESSEHFQSQINRWRDHRLREVGKRSSP